MTHNELIIYGCRVFNFKDDEPFESVEQLLKYARKYFSSNNYSQGLLLYTDALVEFADTNK